MSLQGYIKLHQSHVANIPGIHGQIWRSPWLLVEHFGNLSTVFGGEDPGDQLVEADATVTVPEDLTGWYTNGKKQAGKTIENTNFLCSWKKIHGKPWKHPWKVIHDWRKTTWKTIDKQIITNRGNHKSNLLTMAITITFHRSSMLKP